MMAREHGIDLLTADHLVPDAPGDVASGTVLVGDQAIAAKLKRN